MPLSKSDRIEKAVELEEIQNEMIELIDRARTVLRGTGMIGDRAEAYWLSHLLHAVQQENRYDTTMESTIKELRENDEEDEGEEEEEGEG
jgi:hypothetical protein